VQSLNGDYTGTIDNTTSEQTEIELFAQNLLLEGDRETGKCHKDGTPIIANMVCGFDEVSLNRNCSQSSDEYNPAVCDFDALSEALFREGDIWASRDLLMATVSKIATLQGWTARMERMHIVCNRADRHGRKKTDISIRRRLAAGCTFKLALTPMVRDRKAPPATTTAKRPKVNYIPRWDMPITIREAVCHHGGDCNPSNSRPSHLLQGLSRRIELPRRVKVKNPWRITQNAEQISIDVEVPGAKASDVNLELEEDGRALKVTAETNQKREGVSIKSKIEWSFAVGQDIDTANVTARMDDGVLTMTAPKYQYVKKRVRRIEVIDDSKKMKSADATTSDNEEEGENNEEEEESEEGEHGLEESEIDYNEQESA